MFSDRHRPLKMLLLFVLIILICIYSHSLGQAEVTARDYAQNPELYENATLLTKTGGMVLETGSGYLDVLIDGEGFRILGEVPGIRRGEILEGEFIFHRDRELDIVSIHVHKYRDIKLILSALATLSILSLLFKTYRFDRKKKVLEEKCRT